MVEPAGSAGLGSACWGGRTGAEAATVVTAELEGVMAALAVAAGMGTALASTGVTGATAGTATAATAAMAATGATAWTAEGSGELEAPGGPG